VVAVYEKKKMFTLAKMAYAVCDGRARQYYNDLETLEIQVKPCCLDRLQYMKNETNPAGWEHVLPNSYYGKQRILLLFFRCTGFSVSVV